MVLYSLGKKKIPVNNNLPIVKFFDFYLSNDGFIRKA